MNNTDHLHPDTCGTCAFYNTKITGGKSISHCSCWKVKGKDGNYLPVKKCTKACQHYMPLYASTSVSQ